MAKKIQIKPHLLLGEDWAFFAPLLAAMHDFNNLKVDDLGRDFTNKAFDDKDIAFMKELTLKDMSFKDDNDKTKFQIIDDKGNHLLFSQVQEHGNDMVGDKLKAALKTLQKSNPGMSLYQALNEIYCSDISKYQVYKNFIALKPDINLELVLTTVYALMKKIDKGATFKVDEFEGEYAQSMLKGIKEAYDEKFFELAPPELTAFIKQYETTTDLLNDLIDKSSGKQRQNLEAALSNTELLMPELHLNRAHMYPDDYADTVKAYLVMAEQFKRLDYKPYKKLGMAMAALGMVAVAAAVVLCPPIAAAIGLSGLLATTLGAGAATAISSGLAATSLGAAGLLTSGAGLGLFAHKRKIIDNPDAIKTLGEKAGKTHQTIQDDSSDKVEDDAAEQNKPNGLKGG